MGKGGVFPIKAAVFTARTLSADKTLHRCSISDKITEAVTFPERSKHPTLCSVKRSDCSLHDG